MTPVKPRAAGSAHAAIAALLAQCGGVERAADVVGRRPSTVYGWSDPDAPGAASFHQIALLSELGPSTACAEYLAMRAGGLFLPLPAPDAAEEVADLSAEAAEEFGKAMADLVRAVSPRGEAGAAISPKEAAQILADLDPLMRTLGHIRARALAAAEAGR
ncbi:hypothetical protein HDIA_1968 [Hartmannibacter diazotrophicus]|uniref:Uncharacterized protein n=1 Tax=Hartmannibacter diazotrophicus TaxID=1482074 RepID=A0A2C9D5S2_9HYPH|nr:hypothetical protein [Hartmannibacter diazotrophicus]SON55509.1 hypothetical protein HDIA_1968 [Hartmannibacter diazotrophicus]